VNFDKKLFSNVFEVSIFDVDFDDVDEERLKHDIDLEKMHHLVKIETKFNDFEFVGKISIASCLVIVFCVQPPSSISHR
jgi:hypothetical protein